MDRWYIVAFWPPMLSLKPYWPEAQNVEVMEENVPLTWSDRFPKPSWWKHAD